MAANFMTLKLIAVACEHSQILSSPEPGTNASARYQTLKRTMEVIRLDVEEWGVKDFGLGGSGSFAYARALHYMKLCDMLYGGK